MGKVAENIDRDFIAIRDIYRDEGVFYTLEMFDLELESAISESDYMLVTMICWYEIYVIFEVENIIKNLMIVR